MSLNNDHVISVPVYYDCAHAFIVTKNSNIVPVFVGRQVAWDISKQRAILTCNLRRQASSH